jgi:hypothetical protein
MYFLFLNHRHKTIRNDNHNEQENDKLQTKHKGQITDKRQRSYYRRVSSCFDHPCSSHRLISRGGFCVPLDVFVNI